LVFSWLLSIFFRDLLEEKRHEQNELEREYGVIADRFTKARNDVERFKNEAENEAPLFDRNRNELPLKALLDELAVNTKEEAEAALEEATAKANSIVANPDVVRQYEERKQDIETLQQKIDQIQGCREGRVEELERVRAPWEAQLEQYLSKVNALFCEYMQELGCAGKTMNVRNHAHHAFYLPTDARCLLHTQVRCILPKVDTPREATLLLATSKNGELRSE
jgi:chromosome segregation ATPase